MENWRQRWRRIRETYFRSVWDVLAWVAFAYVVIYALLKVLGVLHSPVEVDVGLIISAAYFLGKYAQKIDFCTREVEWIKHEIHKHESKLIQMEAKYA